MCVGISQFTKSSTSIERRDVHQEAGVHVNQTPALVAARPDVSRGTPGRCTEDVLRLVVVHAAAVLRVPDQGAGVVSKFVAARNGLEEPYL